MSADQMYLLFRRKIICVLINDIIHEEMIYMNVPNIWYKKIFYPLTFTAENAAKVSDRKLIFPVD